MCGVKVGIRVNTKLVGSIDNMGAAHEAMHEVLKFICKDIHKAKTESEKNINHVVNALATLKTGPMFPII
jgi:hypothetical protein